jgi:hypothetical protein
MHMALRLASNMGISQARPMEQAAMTELGTCLTAFPSGPGAFCVPPLRSDCVAYCRQLSLSAFKLSLGDGDVLV